MLRFYIRRSIYFQEIPHYRIVFSIYTVTERLTESACII